MARVGHTCLQIAITVRRWLWKGCAEAWAWALLFGEAGSTFAARGELVASHAQRAWSQPLRGGKLKTFHHTDAIAQ